MRRRGLTEAEARDWETYSGLVRPLRGRSPALPQLPAIAAPPTVPAAASPAPARPTPRATWIAIGDQSAGVDNATWKRLRTGRLPPGRSLDLHGHTAQRALHALEHFLHAAQSSRIRCVEVITGRGTGEAGGVLRRELPLWLNLPHIRPLVLAAAHPHAGNVGATRILLRKGGP